MKIILLLLLVASLSVMGCQSTKEWSKREFIQWNSGIKQVTVEKRAIPSAELTAMEKSTAEMAAAQAEMSAAMNAACNKK